MKIKNNDKLLLLNIFLNKKKILKPNINHIRKPDNNLISIKFIIFFLKKIFAFKKFSSFILCFKIKKYTKESKLKIRKFYIYNKIFSKILKLHILCSKLLDLNVKIKSVYNKSHSIRNLKIKKKRRRKRK